MTESFSLNDPMVRSMGDRMNDSSSIKSEMQKEERIKERQESDFDT